MLQQVTDIPEDIPAASSWSFTELNKSIREIP